VLFAQENDTLPLEPVFSVPGGIHAGPVKVELSATHAKAKVYYTTDGSTPSSGSRRYKNPIIVEGVKIIRAKAYLSGKKPSKVITQSYFTDRKYTLPVVSITTNPDNLWSFERGIHVMGCCANPKQPHQGANFWKGWERRINIEFYEPDGELAFNQEAGIRIFGGWSKGLPMKSFAIVARKKYGKNKFKYQIFADKPIKKFKTFLLRSSGGDFNKTHFRDAYVTSLVKDLDLEIQSYRPATVFLNGEYWGVMNVREKINEHYLKANGGADPDSVDLMKHRDDLQLGTRTHYRNMKKWLLKNNLGSAENLDFLKTQMEVINYLDYNIAETYSDNRDAGGNIRYWRPRTDSGRWRWILFDTDMGLGISDWKAYKKNTVKKFTNVNKEKWPDPPWSTLIIRKLLENKQMELEYINRFADQLNTIYSEETAEQLLNDFIARLEPEMPHHFKKWGGNMKRWEQSLNVVRDFARYRPTYLRKFIMEKFAIKDTSTLAISINHPEQGKVVLNSLNIDESFSGIYFNGVPVTLKAQPHFDYRFVKWEGLDATESEMQLPLKGDLALTAIFEKKPLSNIKGIVINEVCFKQQKKKDSDDWIELHNSSSKAIDLSGWILKDGDEDHEFVFPEGTSLKKSGYMVLSADLEKFRMVYPDSSIVAIGNINFGLRNSGELLRLYDSEALLVDSLSYDTKDPWPPSTENKIGTLALKDPTKENSDGKNWEIPEAPTPGKINQAYFKILEAKNAANTVLYVLLIIGGVIAVVIVVFVVRSKYDPNKHGSHSTPSSENP
jgi:hypothetical protein